MLWAQPHFVGSNLAPHLVPNTTSHKSPHALLHTSPHTPCTSHLAGGLQLLADPSDKLVRRADNEDVGTIDRRLEVRHRDNVVRELSPGEVPDGGGRGSSTRVMNGPKGQGLVRHHVSPTSYPIQNLIRLKGDAHHFAPGVNVSLVDYLR